MTHDFESLDFAAMELADRFESSGQFPHMTRKEIEAAAMGYVMGARHVLDSLGYDITTIQVLSDEVQA